MNAPHEPAPGDAELDEDDGLAPEDSAPLWVLCPTADDAGQRLDVWLEAHLADYSRTRIRDLIRAGHITIDGSPVKPHRKVTPTMTVTVRIPPPQSCGLLPEDIPLSLLYQDDHIIVIDKQPGLVVHPAAGHPTGTLVNALLHLSPDLATIGGEQRPGIVHRLDRDTSGILIVARNDIAMRELQRQFKEHTIIKIYMALVRGVPPQARGTIDRPISRSPHDRKKMAVAAAGKGRESVTHYEVVESFTDAALLRIRLETGRTHQIRVHLSHIGHAVMGDGVYGGKRPHTLAARQMLHATELTISHPQTGQRLTFKSPLPADMAGVLQALRDAATPVPAVVP